MKEDYLWDKTGEPDAEIERLEKQLGQLRFKRPIEPLPLPETKRRSYRLSFSPALAIAATLLVLLLAAGLWLGLRNSRPAEQMVSGPRPPIGPETSPNNKEQQREQPPDDKLTASVSPFTVAGRDPITRRHTVQRQTLPRLPRSSAALNPRREELAREGAHAKAQLILALHIASDKLNMVQKKIQTSPGI
jgi:hypothetical protein